MASGSPWSENELRDSFPWGLPSPSRAGVLVRRPSAGGGRAPHYPLEAGSRGCASGRIPGPSPMARGILHFVYPSLWKTKKKPIIHTLYKARHLTSEHALYLVTDLKLYILNESPSICSDVRYLALYNVCIG